MTASAPSVLVVDDEAPIREMLEFTLSVGGIACVGAATVAEARAAIAETPPSLILLDWMLSRGESGLDFARRLRADEQYRSIPIIMLTVRQSHADAVAALDAGADDFISKPFSPSELKSRIRAVLHRCSPDAERPSQKDEKISAYGVELDVHCRRVTAEGRPVFVGPTDFSLLHFLMCRPEQVYSQSELITYVWGTDTFIDERMIDIHIARLRRALRSAGSPDVIQTVPGAGYRFSPR